MKRSIAAMAALLLPTAAIAAPMTVAVQGVLRSASGGPVADGKYPLGLALHTAEKGGKALFTEKFLGVAVHSGSFALRLGAAPDAKLDDAIFLDAAGKLRPIWIGVSVGGDPELTRVPLTPVPLAIHARTARWAAAAQLADKAKAADVAGAAEKADYAKTAGAAKEADYAKTAGAAKEAGHAKAAEIATKLQCTGCVRLAHLDAKLTEALVAAKRLHPVALSGKYADLSGGPDLSGLARLAKPNAWAARQGFSQGFGLGADADFAGHQALAFRFQSSAKEPMPCSAKTVGMVYYNTQSSSLMLCNGKRYRVFAIASARGSQANPGTSCADILEQEGKVPSGTYWIDPDGPGGTKAWQARCEMETEGGGWTRFLVITNQYRGLQGVANSVEFVSNGTFIFSKTLLKNSDRMVLIKETVAPYRMHMYDFKQYTNPNGEDFVGTVTGDRGATVAVWDWLSKKWRNSGKGQCNTNNHSQWNCTPPTGVRFHYPTRDWTGNGGGYQNSGLTWVTSYAPGFGNLAHLVKNWNGKYDKTPHDVYVR